MDDIDNNVILATCFLDNYGACLQAFALQSLIESLGHKCEILNYVGTDGYKNKANLKSRVYNNPVCKFLYAVVNRDYRGLTYLRGKKFDSFRKQYLKFTKETVCSVEDAENCDFDAKIFVCGSDQIWNPTFYRGNNRIYFLDFVKNDSKRISYAPSIGLNNIPHEYQEEFVRLVEKMDAISVRELTGKTIIENLSKKKATVVPDPTLMLNKETWKKAAEAAKVENGILEKHYIFCYLFAEREYYNNAVDILSKRLGMPVVYITLTRNQRKNEKYICVENAGPMEFVNYIMNAGFVITDSFHATAFSINLNVPFFSFLRSGVTSANNMNSRIFDVLKEYGLEDRLVDENVNFEAVETDLSFKNSNEKLEMNRALGMDFLKNAIAK